MPNPAKKRAYQHVEKATRALQLAENASDAALLDAHSPQPGTSVVLTNTMINTINAEVHTAHTALDTALTAHQAIPARLPLSQVNPGQQVLDTETKLIHHAIRIAAYNTAQTLARAILTATGYTRNPWPGWSTAASRIEPVRVGRDAASPFHAHGRNERG